MPTGSHLTIDGEGTLIATAKDMLRLGDITLEVLMTTGIPTPVGEVVIVDEADKLVFSGDILVNPKGFTKPQAEYNLLAPYMMSSVNVNSALASAERKYLLNLFKPEEYAYATGHGAILHPGESAR